MPLFPSLTQLLTLDSVILPGSWASNAKQLSLLKQNYFGCQGECYVASDVEMPFLKLAGTASRVHLRVGIYLM